MSSLLLRSSSLNKISDESAEKLPMSFASLFHAKQSFYDSYGFKGEHLSAQFLPYGDGGDAFFYFHPPMLAKGLNRGKFRRELRSWCRYGGLEITGLVYKTFDSKWEVHANLDTPIGQYYTGLVNIYTDSKIPGMFELQIPVTGLDEYKTFYNKFLFFMKEPTMKDSSMSFPRNPNYHTFMITFPYSIDDSGWDPSVAMKFNDYIEDEGFNVLVNPANYQMIDNNPTINFVIEVYQKLTEKDYQQLSTVVNRFGSLHFPAAKHLKEMK